MGIEAAGGLDSPVGFRERFRLIERELNIDASAKVILWMIFDRTIGWGKSRERIPVRHFVLGVVSGSKDIIHPGTGLSRATILRKLEFLIKSGIVLKHSICDYEINFDKMEKMSLLRRSKKMLEKGYQKDTIEVSKRDPNGIKKIPHKRGQSKEETILKKAAARRSPPSLELTDTLEAIESRSRTRKFNRRQSINDIAGVPKAAVVGAMWNDAVSAAFPDYHLPSQTQKSIATLRSYAYRFCKIRGPKDDRLKFEKFSNYMDWLTLEWGLIMDNRFDWCDNSPPVPEIKFLVGMAQHFERAWIDREVLEALRKMTPCEAFRSRLIAKGKSEEAVDRAVNDRFHVKDEIDKLDKARRGVRSEREALIADRGRKAQADDRKAAKDYVQHRMDRLKEDGEYKWEGDS